MSFGYSGLFRSISAEIQDSAGMSWSYGVEYRERKREVLRYRCDVRECFLWDREQTKGENKFNTCLSAFNIKIEATSKMSAISVSSPSFFKVLRETRFWTRNMQMGYGVGRVINGRRYLNNFITLLFNHLLLQVLLSIFLIILSGYVWHNLNDECSTRGVQLTR